MWKWLFFTKNHRISWNCWVVNFKKKKIWPIKAKNEPKNFISKKWILYKKYFLVLFVHQCCWILIRRWQKWLFWPKKIFLEKLWVRKFVFRWPKYDKSCFYLTKSCLLFEFWFFFINRESFSSSGPLILWTPNEGLSQLREKNIKSLQRDISFLTRNLNPFYFIIEARFTFLITFNFGIGPNK